MPAPKKLETYPEWMFEIVDYFRKGGKEPLELDPAPHGKCVNTRQRFYTFRNLLLKDDASFWGKINAMQIRIVAAKDQPDMFVVVFENIDETDIAVSIREKLAALRQKQGLDGDAGHPMRRSTDFTPQPELPADTPVESTIGEMDDDSTNLLKQRGYGSDD